MDVSRAQDRARELPRGEPLRQELSSPLLLFAVAAAAPGRDRHRPASHHLPAGGMMARRRA